MIDGVAVNGIHRCGRVTVYLTTYQLRCTATYPVVFRSLRSRIDGEVQAIDTIGIVDGVIAVFDRLGHTYFAIQIIVLMVGRSGGPFKRQLGFADRGISLEEISRVNDEDEFLLVVTSAVGLLRMVIRAGIIENRITCHTA